MGKIFFKELDFASLTLKSKFILIILFVGIFYISYFHFPSKISIILIGDHLIRNNIIDKIRPVVEALLLSFIWAIIALFTLPRVSYYRQEYFCADCGQFLGYSPSYCDRCGCNRYTTDGAGVGKSFRSR